MLHRFNGQTIALFEMAEFLESVEHSSSVNMVDLGSEVLVEEHAVLERLVPLQKRSGYGLAFLGEHELLRALGQTALETRKHSPVLEHSLSLVVLNLRKYHHFPLPAQRIFMKRIEAEFAIYFSRFMRHCQDQPLPPQLFLLMVEEATHHSNSQRMHVKEPRSLNCFPFLQSFTRSFL